MVVTKRRANHLLNKRLKRILFVSGLDRKDSHSSKDSKLSVSTIEVIGDRSSVITTPVQILETVRPKSKPLLQVKTR